MKKLKISDLRVGTDPEVFIRDELGFVSAHGYFPGTKDKPFKVDKGAIQVDGLALEFNIDPAKDENEFDLNIEIVMTQMQEMVKKIDPTWQIEIIPVARFDAEYFRDIVPDEAKILGCDPDYDLKGNMKTPDPELGFRPFRTAAGHVHIGWLPPEEFEKNPLRPEHMADCRHIAQRFANIGGFYPASKSELERVAFYGSSGSHRPKPYGVELRSPSNLWIKQRATRRGMFRKVRSVMSGYMEA